MGERKSRRWYRCFPPAFCVMMAAVSARGEPIESILIDFVDPAGPPPLQYQFDETTGQGTLTVSIDSLTVLVERSNGEESVPEFIPGASFMLSATVMTDVSQPPLAAGVFGSVEFELSAGKTTLLSGSNTLDAGVIYAETEIRDVMLIAGGNIPITGGSLAADFDLAATLAGLGFLIDPSTEVFDTLNVDHAGAIKVNLNPIPEPGSGVFLAVVIGGLCRRRRGRLRS